MNWYIVQSYSGFEKKVVESIKDSLKKNKLDQHLDQILVPTHQVTEVKKGKRTKKEKKYFPGYVLIKIDLTKQIYHLIKNLQKVSGFLGSSDKPTPISDGEIKRILGQVSESAVNQKSGISFEIGEKVKVCDGPFASFMKKSLDLKYQFLYLVELLLLILNLIRLRRDNIRWQKKKLPGM